MIVAACPSCRENVTVPIDARPTSIVRCPLCNAEFRLEHFLAQLPPPLIVLTQPDSLPDTSSIPADSAIAEGVGIYDLAEHDVAIDLGASGESDEPVPAFDFAPSAAEAVAGPREVVRRPARPRTNAPWEIFKIVGGALLAVPAAQIILWWCVPYSWKRDLLGIGPAVSRVAPWVVPARFHEKVAAKSREPAQEASDDRSAVALQDTPMGKASGWRSNLPTLDERPVESARDQDDAKPGITLIEDRPPVAPPTAIDLEPTPPVVSPAAPRAEQPAVPSSGASAHEQPTEPERVPPSAVETPTPKFRAADLQGALERALQASVAWDMAPSQTPEAQAALTDEFYTAFAGLGETVTFMAPGDPAARALVDDVNDLLASLQPQPKKLVMIGNRSAQWLDQPARSNRGVFLFGTVSQVQPEGGLFTTELELASPQKRTVRIFSRIDPTGFYAPGDHLLMLGAFISDPAQNLPGYEGQAAEVVFGGFPVRLR